MRPQGAIKIYEPIKLQKMVRISDCAKDVIKTFGKKTQLEIAKEELAELIVAISHLQRGRQNAEAEVRRGMADVAFVIYQLMEIVQTSSVMLADNIIEKYERCMKEVK